MTSAALAVVLLAAAASSAAPARPAAATAPSRDAILAMFARSYYPGRSGQLMVVPRRTEFVTRTDPFMHGTPWDHDARVPLFLYGPGHVRRGRFPAAARHQDIAPTISAMLALPPAPTMTGTPRREALRRATAPPRIVALLVLDAFRADYLERHAARLPHLTRLRREGADFPRARVDYMPTATSVAHATIATGAPPSVPGIAVNANFDPVTGQLSDPFPGRSPRNLMAPALADVWAAATEGRAVIAAQAGLFYAAGSLGGHGACQHGGRASIAYAYDREHGTWSTGEECYRMPEYLKDRHPRAIWEAAEGTWLGHSIADPGSVRRSAMFSAYEMDALLAVLDREPFGADEVPDLLMANLKTPDFVGHQYGPDSPEMAETLAALDVEVGRLVKALEGKAGAGRFAVVVTADHGMPSLAFGDDSHRHRDTDVRDGLNARFDPEKKELVRSYEASSAQMFVSRTRLRELGLTLVDLARHLESLPWMQAAFTEDEVRTTAARRRP